MGLHRFKEPIITTAENGMKVEFIGWYDMGDNVTIRGYIYLNDDKLDFIIGKSKSEYKGDNNV